jgi:hypothetical protein
MPRKKKESSAEKKSPAPPATYHKAKNGRFYKKVQINGKMRVRFVSSAEANGHLSSTSKTKTTKPTKQKKPRARRKPKKKEEDVPSADDEKKSE